MALVQKYIPEGKNVEDAPAEYARCRLIVNVYHNPPDIESREILESVKDLLNRGSFIAWFFDGQSVRNRQFEADMAATISRDCGEDGLQRCLFSTMTPDIAELPINFTVVAPHYPSDTITYMRFPDDNELRFVLKMRTPGVLTKRFDRLALRCLANVSDGILTSLSPAWSDLVQKARSEVPAQSDIQQAADTQANTSPEARV